MRQGNVLLAISQVAVGAVLANRFITPAGAIAGAGVNVQGVAQANAADGTLFGKSLIGTEIVETGGALAAGALVESDATGRAITHNLGVAVARLAPGESATGAGQFVLVHLFAN